MKFIDILKVSLRNMWNNKTRTLLVTLVLFVLSTLVTMILAFCIDMMDLVNYQTNTSEEPLDLTICYENYSSGPAKRLSEAEIENYKSKLYEPNAHLFKGLLYFANNCDFFVHNGGYSSYTNVSFVDINTNPYEGEDVLIAGRLWNKEDLNKNYIWVSKQYAIQNNVQVGDKVKIEIKEHSNGEELKFQNVEVEIVGILNKVKGTDWWSNYDFAIGSEHMKEWGLEPNYMKMESSKLIQPNIFEIIKLKKVADEYNQFEYGKNTSGIHVFSYKAEEAKYTIITIVAVIGGGFFLSLIVILLSIGCVSNSIQITVEQNRKFFGVLKAVGLRDNTVKKIVRYQAVIMIIFAVAVAAGVSVGVLESVKPMIFKAFGVELSAVAFTLPAYVPFVVFLMLMLLLMLFTRKSLNKISKMDVVSVISEVN